MIKDKISQTTGPIEINQGFNFLWGFPKKFVWKNYLILEVILTPFLGEATSIVCSSKVNLFL